jgi:hypothetical protein
VGCSQARRLLFDEHVGKLASSGGTAGNRNGCFDQRLQTVAFQPTQVNRPGSFATDLRQGRSSLIYQLFK